MCSSDLIRNSSGDVVVPMDGDGQNDPADIPRLIAKLAEGGVHKRDDLADLALVDERVWQLVADDERAAAIVRFSGEHRGELLGVAATGRTVEWTGAAFFRFHAGLMKDIWVLADVAALRQQLLEGDASADDSRS